MHQYIRVLYNSNETEEMWRNNEQCVASTKAASQIIYQLKNCALNNRGVTTRVEHTVLFLILLFQQECCPQPKYTQK